MKLLSLLLVGSVVDGYLGTWKDNNRQYGQALRHEYDEDDYPYLEPCSEDEVFLDFIS